MQITPLAVMIEPSPCMVQTASSSPPNGTPLLSPHHPCLLLSDAGFHILALRVSVEKKKKHISHTLLHHDV